MLVLDDRGPPEPCPWKAGGGGGGLGEVLRVRRRGIFTLSLLRPWLLLVRISVQHLHNHLSRRASGRHDGRRRRGGDGACRFSVFVCLFFFGFFFPLLKIAACADAVHKIVERNRLRVFLLLGEPLVSRVVAMWRSRAAICSAKITADSKGSSPCCRGEKWREGRGQRATQVNGCGQRKI